jgi:hypothetical protein
MEAVPSSETLVTTYKGRAITQAVTRPILTAEARSVDAGFVVDEVKPGQISPEYFCFSCQFSLYQMLHFCHLSSGARRMGQFGPSSTGLGLTLP